MALPSLWTILDRLAMRYYVEESLSNFKFWSGGKDRADLLTSEQLDKLDDELSQLLSEDPSDGEINDLFWYDFEAVCSLIGLKYTKDAEVVEDEEEWVRNIIDEYNHVTYEIYIEDFLDNYSLGDANSKQEVKDLFDDYVSDYWLDHANAQLEENFPDVDESLRSAFADEYWQNSNTDQNNLNAFAKWFNKGSVRPITKRK